MFESNKNEIVSFIRPENNPYIFLLKYYKAMRFNINSLLEEDKPSIEELNNYKFKLLKLQSNFIAGGYSSSPILDEIKAKILEIELTIPDQIVETEKGITLIQNYSYLVNIDHITEYMLKRFGGNENSEIVVNAENYEAILNWLDRLLKSSGSTDFNRSYQIINFIKNKIAGISEFTKYLVLDEYPFLKEVNDLEDNVIECFLPIINIDTLEKASLAIDVLRKFEKAYPDMASEIKQKLLQVINFITQSYNVQNLPEIKNQTN